MSASTLSEYPVRRRESDPSQVPRGCDCSRPLCPGKGHASPSHIPAIGWGLRWISSYVTDVSTITSVLWASLSPSWFSFAESLKVKLCFRDRGVRRLTGAWRVGWHEASLTPAAGAALLCDSHGAGGHWDHPAEFVASLLGVLGFGTWSLDIRASSVQTCGEIVWSMNLYLVTSRPPPSCPFGSDSSCAMWAHIFHLILQPVGLFVQDWPVGMLAD